MLETREQLEELLKNGVSDIEAAAEIADEDPMKMCIRDRPIMTEEMEQALIHVADTLRKKEAESMPARMDSLEARLYAIRSGLPGYSSMVSRAISYVDRNIHRNISLSDVCDELLVSMSHFSKCFKKETGAGFSSYVTMLKMENARILLRNPKNRVNEVARMLGYLSLIHI